MIQEIIFSLSEFAIPGLDFFEGIGKLSPGSYEAYKELPESPHAGRIIQVFKNILEQENCKDAQYKESITDILEDLPEEMQSIDSLLKYRIKIVETKGGSMYLTGTSLGKYYICIPNHISEESESALDFLATHELAHALNDDVLEISGVRIVAGAVTALACQVLFGLSFTSFLISISLILAVRSVASIVFSHYREYRADDFAMKYASIEDISKAIVAFKRWEDLKKQYSSFFDNVIEYMIHPPLRSRIERLEKVMESKKKEATQLDNAKLAG